MSPNSDNALRVRRCVKRSGAPRADRLLAERERHISVCAGGYPQYTSGGSRMSCLTMMFHTGTVKVVAPKTTSRWWVHFGLISTAVVSLALEPILTIHIVAGIAFAGLVVAHLNQRRRVTVSWRAAYFGCGRCTDLGVGLR